MQPTIVFTAPVPAMIRLNGRFAGETGPDRPLMTPAAPFGALYAEYTPLAAGQRPAAFKCVFSGGRLIPGSLSGAEGVSAVQWPGSILEMEINRPEPTSEAFSAGPVAGILDRGSETVLRAGSLRISLPEGADIPQFADLGGVPALKGSIGEGGQYLAALTADLSAVTGFLTADRIDAGDGGILHTMTASGDIVGHGRLEQWMITEDGLNRLSSEPVWAGGGPAWPQTAGDTVIAAVQAALEGLQDESRNYFLPALADTSPLNAVADVCDLCLPMKYALPDSRPCVALMRVENPHLASVSPLYYRAQPGGGLQGPWQISGISME